MEKQIRVKVSGVDGKESWVTARSVDGNESSGDGKQR